MSLRRFLAEPLVQFLLIGALLFVGHRALGWRGDDEIVIAEAAVEATVRALEERNGATPSPAERAAIVQGLGDEEILIREAIALGLDRGDPIVRRRLAQKMRFVLEDQVSPATEEELQAWLEAHPERYRRQPRRTFEHLFFVGRSGQARAQEALERIRAGAVVEDGNGFTHGRRQEALTERAIASRFGDAFARTVMELPLDAWTAIPSSAGWHLVRVEEAIEGEMPSLDAVRREVEADWRHARREDRVEAGMQALRARYRVRVEESTP